MTSKWVCSRDEVPVETAEGGLFCAAEDYSLQDGERFDPLGNRPLDCTDRRGWVQITRASSTGPEVACWPDSRPLSEQAMADGWAMG